MKLIEALFEGALWRSRYVVLFAVAASMAAGFAIFYMATVDVVYLVSHILHYADPDMTINARKALHDETIAHIVEVVDGYLLAKVIIMILIVTLFESALKQKMDNPLDLLYLGGSIALIGLALYLTHKAESHGEKGSDEGEEHGG